MTASKRNPKVAAAPAPKPAPQVGDKVIPQRSESAYIITRVSPDGYEVDIALPQQCPNENPASSAPGPVTHLCRVKGPHSWEPFWTLLENVWRTIYRRQHARATFPQSDYQ